MKRLAIAFIIFVSLASVAEANVIFPAFSAPYVLQVFLPAALVAALVTEVVVYMLQCRSLRIHIALLLVVGVNLVSWLAGILITGYLFPSGYGSSNFELYAYLGYLVAYGLSILIEGTCLVGAARKWPIPSPFRLAFFANTASYVVLGGMVWWGLKAGWG